MPAAQAVTQAVLGSPVCRISNIVVNCRLPVADLAGRGPSPLPPTIDLSGPPGPSDGSGFVDEDAAVVAVALRARGATSAASAQQQLGGAGASAPAPLEALALPPACNARLGRPAVEALVAALASLPGLQVSRAMRAAAIRMCMWRLPLQAASASSLHAWASGTSTA